MINQPEEKLKSLLKRKIDNENFKFRQWFLKQFAGDSENPCSLEEFAVYFLNTLRQYTEVYTKTNCPETPKCQTPVKSLKSYNNAEEEATPKRLLMNLSQQNPSVSNDSIHLSNDQLKMNSNIDFNSPSSRLSSSLDRLGFSNNSTATPVKRNMSNNSRRLSSTPVSANTRSATPSLCLGDFLVLNTPSHSRANKKKSTPTTHHQSAQKLQSDKPKKRLQPISISKKFEKCGSNSSIFAGESSFSKDNNILKISNTELEDKDQCAILAARKSLALNASQITKEIGNVSIPLMPAVADTIATSTPVKEDDTTVDISLNLKKLQNNVPIRRLAEIYALIIDLNLTTSILNELSFLLNLLNAPSSNNVLQEVCNNADPFNMNDNEPNEASLAMLQTFSNAIYFALLCLEYEKQSLASLDAKSLGVVLISERFAYLPDEVKTYLLKIYQSKQQFVVQKPFCDSFSYFDSKACTNVHFQQEQDSRDNFTSHQEFTNFRAQRDLFYKCLKIWESNHLNPTWIYSDQITPKIRELFYISENCINMAHLAKLFVSQLLLSASNASSPEEIGLDVDQEKLCRLTQRLIAPSQFSVDYQFPRTEAFFRDFIMEARSLVFVEQLKMELYKQLTTQNDSSLDHVNISNSKNDADEQNVSLGHSSPSDNVIVRPDILNSMLILAKFLGFTTALPYNISSGNTISAKVEADQVKLRSLMQPTFDVCMLLEQAIEQSKLLIVIPWLIQYFSMLDNITLQLENYTKAIKILFALYSFLGSENSKPFCSTSLFIIKLCLGWLFESKQFIAEQYYNYRVMLKIKSSEESTNEMDFVRSKFICSTIDCTLSEGIALNPHLESLLPIACPFLAEFRVSIMPAKYAQTKNASRTGRYRHITTRIAELPCSVPIKEDEPSSNIDQNKPKEVQKSLIQAFLHSQSSSTRQTIKFCTERCYKSTVKDGQLKILLPAKTNADNLVNQITSFQYQFVYTSIKSIYGEAYAQTKAEWKEIIPKILHKRIETALESLLPEDTSVVLKRTYFMIIEKEADFKISEWFDGNIIKDNYFCPDMNEVANKICIANKNKVQMGSNLLTITKETPSTSELIDELQYWLHCTSIRVDRFKDTKPLVRLLKNLIESFGNELPSFLYHLLAAGIVQLLQHIITKHCSHLTDELIEVACQAWLNPNMQKALANSTSTDICIYNSLITITFIESLNAKRECFHQLGQLIIVMIKKQVITANDVNELFVSIFKHDWQPLVLTEISNMLKSIAEETSKVQQKTRENRNANDAEDEEDNEKSYLFMDMLADLSRDVDFF